MSCPHDKSSYLFKKKCKTRLRASVVLEKAFWDAIKITVLQENVALHDFSQMVQEWRCTNSLTKSLRLVTLLYFQSMAKIKAILTR
jgi:predicted DNA-binding ribbon-helix-helix protein